MTNATMQSKIVNLMRQSRQASRLYASVRHIDANHLTELARIQSEEWRLANDSLCKSLGEVLKRPSSRHMGQELLFLTEHHRDEWRSAEKELHQGHKNLNKAIEQSDYVASTVIASTLVRWKARKEAQQAVHEELLHLIRTCRVTPTSERGFTEEEASSSFVSSSSSSGSRAIASGEEKTHPVFSEDRLDHDYSDDNQLAKVSTPGTGTRSNSSPDTPKAETFKSETARPNKYESPNKALSGKIIPINRNHR
jgi:hypothetical protein